MPSAYPSNPVVEQPLWSNSSPMDSRRMGAVRAKKSAGEPRDGANTITFATIRISSR
jgi:hypothetical protein